MSITAMKVLSILKEMFPANPHKRVFEEHYVRYKGQKLFFDFYVKELDAYIEVQGRQHTEFVKHFHGSAEGFKSQKYRDNLKIEYVQEQGSCLVRIYDTEKITKAMIKKKISKAIEECFYE